MIYRIYPSLILSYKDKLLPIILIYKTFNLFIILSKNNNQTYLEFIRCFIVIILFLKQLSILFNFLKMN